MEYEFTHDMATGGVTLDIEPEDFVPNASMSAGENTLPLFHFWGGGQSQGIMHFGCPAFSLSDLYGFLKAEGGGI